MGVLMLFVISTNLLFVLQ